MDGIKELSQRAANQFPKSEKTDLGLRLRRATSWLLKASQEHNDPAARFIFCWIALNSAYGINEIAMYPQKLEESDQRLIFFKKIERLQNRNELHYLVRDELKEEVSDLLDNEYVFKQYWIFELGNNETDFLAALESCKRRFRRASKNMETAEMLKHLFVPLTTLRNQLIHGSATWKGTQNPRQVVCGSKIISRIVPKMIEIMMLGPDEDWSKPSYPPTFMLDS